MGAGGMGWVRFRVVEGAVGEAPGEILEK